MTTISTPRLRLIQLSRKQLEVCLSDFPALEDELNLTIAGDFLTERVQRAIRMKVEKIRDADESQQAWLTYWLVVIKEESIGAGMLGFKGYPNAEGSTEIGYGIAPAYQNRGYMSEAVRALIDWAFTHPFCREITATEVYNPASECLLQKLEAIQTEKSDDFTSWKIQKSHLSIPAKCV